MSLTRKDLDRARCADPACTGACGAEDELFLHATCHPGAALHVGYRSQTGELWLYCAVCDDIITRVLVAAEPSHVH